MDQTWAELLGKVLVHAVNHAPQAGRNVPMGVGVGLALNSAHPGRARIGYRRRAERRDPRCSLGSTSGGIADGLEDPGRGGQVGAGVVVVLDMMCVRPVLGPVQDPRVREAPAQLGGEPRFELGHLVAAVDELDSAEL